MIFPRVLALTNATATYYFHIDAVMSGTYEESDENRNVEESTRSKY